MGCLQGHPGRAIINYPPPTREVPTLLPCLRRCSSDSEASRLSCPGPTASSARGRGPNVRLLVSPRPPSPPRVLLPFRRKHAGFTDSSDAVRQYGHSVDSSREHPASRPS
jgi:hypothetical protein